MAVPLLALVVATLLTATLNPAGAQSCVRITANDLGNTTSPSSQGLIAAILSAPGQPGTAEIQLLRYNRVCESTSGTQDEFRSVSLVAEYVMDNSTLLSQFEFACMSGTPGDVWDIEVSGSTQNTVTTPPIATLNTTLRQDCYQCISPERDTSSSRTEHCLVCDPSCFGLLMCTSPFSCCNFLTPDGMCRDACPDTANSTADFNCECLPGYTGGDCSVNIDECASNPCGENGNCTDAVNGFNCDCVFGYTGATCSESIGNCGGDVSCENGGTCVRNNTSGFAACQCTGGFQGTLCQDPIPSARCGRGCFIAIIVVVVVLIVGLTVATVIAAIVVTVRNKKKGKGKITKRKKKPRQRKTKPIPTRDPLPADEATIQPSAPVEQEATGTAMTTFGEHPVTSTPELAASSPDHVGSSPGRFYKTDPKEAASHQSMVTTDTFGIHQQQRVTSDSDHVPDSSDPVPESVDPVTDNSKPPSGIKDSISMELSDL